MNPQQIETAARDFCRRIGVDPDELVTPPEVAPWQGDEPRWKSYIWRVIQEYERQAMEGAVRAATKWPEMHISNQASIVPVWDTTCEADRL